MNKSIINRRQRHMRIWFSAENLRPLIATSPSLIGLTAEEKLHVVAEMCDTAKAVLRHAVIQGVCKQTLSEINNAGYSDFILTSYGNFHHAELRFSMLYKSAEFGEMIRQPYRCILLLEGSEKNAHLLPRKKRIS